MIKLKKLMAIFLVAIAMVMSGCTLDQPAESNSNADSTNPVVAEKTVAPTAYGDVVGEKHEYNISETNKYVLQNGKTDYKILMIKVLNKNKLPIMAHIIKINNAKSNKMD